MLTRLRCCSRRSGSPCSLNQLALQWFEFSTKAALIYEVSNLGRWKTLRGEVVRGAEDSDGLGYRRVRVYGKHVLLHRIVCYVFNGPPDSDMHRYVHHIDGNPSNNEAVNLKWVTVGENNCERTRTTLNTLLSKPVEGRRANHGDGTWIHYASASEAARQLQLERTKISAICRGERGRKTTHGFEFRFAGTDGEDLNNEEWRPAILSDTSPPHPVVRVSNLGRIMNSYKIISWGSRRSRTGDGGYRTSTIDGKSYRLHRLVNLTFNGPPPSPDCTEVNHVDGDRTNNAASNLEWCTPKQNTRHARLLSPQRAHRREPPSFIEHLPGEIWRSAPRDIYQRLKQVLSG